MADHASVEGRVWGERLAAFYAQRVALTEAETDALRDRMAEAVAAAVRSALPPRRWPDPVNRALDLWEEGRPARGPRVSYFDVARGHVTVRD